MSLIVEKLIKVDNVRMVEVRLDFNFADKQVFGFFSKRSFSHFLQTIEEISKYMPKS